MALLGGTNGRGEQAVSFPEWKHALEKITASHERGAHMRAILGFLHHCKSVRAPATVTLAKQYIDACERQAGRLLESLRGPLRWFFRAAARA